MRNRHSNQRPVLAALQRGVDGAAAVMIDTEKLGEETRKL
jgi:ribonuclease D